MNYSLFRILSLLLIMGAQVPALSGQSFLDQVRTEIDSTLDSTAAPILPIPVSDILEESARSLQMVSDANEKRLTGTQVNRMDMEIDSLFSQVDTFLNDPAFQTFDELSTLELDNAGNLASIYLDLISQKQSVLASRHSELRAELDGLIATGKRWLLTSDQSADTQIPGALEDNIVLTIGQIDSVASQLQDDINTTLLHQDRLMKMSNRLEAFRGRIQETKELRRERMLSRNMPGFFDDLSNLKEPGLVRSHTRQLVKSLRSDGKVFRSEFSGSMVLVVVLFVALLILLYRVKNNYARFFSPENIPISKLHLTLIEAPLLVALFLTTLLIRLVFHDLPYTIRSINSIILMVPMFILTVRIFGSVVRRWMIWIMIIYIFTVLYEFLYLPDILQRIFLLFLSFSGMLMFLWIVLGKASYLFKNKSLYTLLHSAGIVFAVMLLVAIIANLVGVFGLAEFLTLSIIQIAFLTLVIKLITSFTDIIIYLVLASTYFQKINSIREYFEVIQEKTSRVTALFFWLLYLVSVLSILRVREAFLDWGQRLLSTGRSIGEVEITPKSILIFVFVIWLSMFISKIARYILEKDVFVRVTTSKGVPGTIIMLVRIALISFGFLLAAAAAGMELTNLSIVLGAFSVGIGFGLQNIFNNMVSGLILSFERPINVGDVVQVGDLMGTVLSIGLRASRIKSFEGAEVIVPNGNLISDSLINWTLSDAYRRMEIPVGVAYGTDPEIVLEIMKSAGEDHELVKKEPLPNAYFMGFGDSSLDFRLLAWVDNHNRLEVESELFTAINKRLIEAGIEIPFPQRDLHIRSDATRSEPPKKE